METALDKPWIHGGAVVEGETARAGRAAWRPSYVRQREHKREQPDEMFRFAESHGCRMLHLLRHFGEQEDGTRPCGRCDACAPRETVVRRWSRRSRSGARGRVLRRHRGRVLFVRVHPAERPSRAALLARASGM